MQSRARVGSTGRLYAYFEMAPQYTSRLGSDSFFKFTQYFKVTE